MKFRAGRLSILLFGLLMAGTWLGGFNLSDHARMNLTRPAPLLTEWRAADLCTDTAAVKEDPLSSDGRAVLLSVGKPKLTFRTPELERGTYSVFVIGRGDSKPSTYREPMVLHFSVSGSSVGQWGRKSEQWRMRINYENHRYQDVAHFYFDLNAKGTVECALELGHDSMFGLWVDRLELRDVLGNTMKKGYKNASTVYVKPTVGEDDPEDEPDSKAVTVEKAGKRQKSRIPYTRAELLKLAADVAASFPPRNAILTSGGMPTEGWYQEFHPEKGGIAEPGASRWAWSIQSALEDPWIFKGPTVPKKRDELDEILTGLSDDTMGGAGKDKLKVAAKNEVSFGKTPDGWPDFNWGSESLGGGAEYRAEDFRAFRKTPSRWPDDGTGYFVPEKESGKFKHNFYYNAMAGAFKSRYERLRTRAVELADEYYRTGNPRTGMLGVLMLIFWSDAFPSLDNTVQGTCNITWGNGVFNDFSGRSYGVFGKLDYSGWAGPNNVPPILAYDKLFPLLKGNQDLADAVGTVIPWVKTPEDVIELLDVKLVQHYFDVANRMEVRLGTIRCVPEVAVIQGDNEAGRKMLDMIVNHSDFQFASLLDSLVSSLSRDCTTYIGSRSYATGPGLAGAFSLATLHNLAEQGLVAKPIFDRMQVLTILEQGADMFVDTYAGGIHIDGVGDVSGPEGRYDIGGRDDTGQKILYAAWKKAGDPRHAWMLHRIHGIPEFVPFSDRKAIEKASQAVKRDPRFDQESRALEGFGTIVLEGNAASDDYRERNSLVMRTGYGSGHSHGDQLNIELFSRGIVAVPEFGGRGGYGVPPTTAAESHWLVTVDGRVGYAGWTSLVAHLPETPCAEGWWKHQNLEVRRFVSLVDAGNGNAYVFDVNRARGGKRRTYYFHGNETEPVDVEGAGSTRTSPLVTSSGDVGIDSLIQDLAKEESAKDGFVWSRSMFSHNLGSTEKEVSISGNVYQAVWPLKKSMEERIQRRAMGFGYAEGMKPTVTPPSNSPRIFTRLNLFDVKGMTNKVVIASSDQVNYRIPCIQVSEEKKEEDVSVFTALVDCFTAEPFVESTKRLAVAGTDSMATALEVNLAGSRTDVLVQSDVVDAVKEVKGANPISATGRFAFLSVKDKIPRAFSLVNGTCLEGKNGVGIQTDAAAYDATIAEVDFTRHTITLDRKIPTSLVRNSCFIIGSEPFHVGDATDGETGTVLHLKKSALAIQAPLFTVYRNAAVGIHECDKILPNGWITNEAGDKAWPLAQILDGALRWMPTGHRGGATSGFKADWDEYPDLDGDGVRTVQITENASWKGPMKLNVIDVDPALRVFCFESLNSPEGYAGTRSYAGGKMVNEAGKWVGVSVIPGKMASFEAPEDKPMRKEDFTDADGDGVVKFYVYHFGPGTPVRLATYASVTLESEGVWLLAANAPVKITVPRGKEERAAIQNPDGTQGAEIPSEPGGDGTLRLNFDEKRLGDSLVRFKLMR